MRACMSWSVVCVSDLVVVECSVCVCVCVCVLPPPHSSAVSVLPVLVPCRVCWPVLPAMSHRIIFFLEKQNEIRLHFLHKGCLGGVHDGWVFGALCAYARTRPRESHTASPSRVYHPGPNSRELLIPGVATISQAPQVHCKVHCRKESRVDPCL